MRCPICKQFRNHELHSNECSKKAKLLVIDRTKAAKVITPDYRGGAGYGGFSFSSKRGFE